MASGRWRAANLPDQQTHFLSFGNSTPEASPLETAIAPSILLLVEKPIAGLKNKSHAWSQQTFPEKPLAVGMATVEQLAWGQSSSTLVQPRTVFASVYIRVTVWMLNSLPANHCSIFQLENLWINFIFKSLTLLSAAEK